MYLMHADDHLEPLRGVESEFASPLDVAPNRAARRKAKQQFNM